MSILAVLQVAQAYSGPHNVMSACTSFVQTPPTAAPCPTNLHWLANVSPAKRGAHSRKAVSSRFAFRVALRGHPIAGQRRGQLRGQMPGPI